MSDESAARRGPTPSLRLTIVRHAQTAWSQSGQHTGRTDLPLDEGGREQARQLGARLAHEPIDAVFSSPMRRAFETAELAGFSSPTLLEDLREWDYGSYEGRTTAEIRLERPDWELFRDGCPDGESPERVVERAQRALETIGAAVPAGNVVVFAHGHILRVLAGVWIGMAAMLGRHLLLDPCGVSVLTGDRDTHVIVAWNH